MSEFEPESYDDAELEAEFDCLFPQGFAGADVRQELAPEGWENSPLLAVYHPTSAQLYEEAVRFHRNLLELRSPDASDPVPPEPNFDEVALGRATS